MPIVGRIGSFSGGYGGSVDAAEKKLGVKVQWGEHGKILNLEMVKAALKNYERYYTKNYNYGKLYDQDIANLSYRVYEQEYDSKLLTKVKRSIEEKIHNVEFKISHYFEFDLPNDIDDTIVKIQAASIRKIGKPAIDSCINKYKEAVLKGPEKSYWKYRHLLFALGETAVPGLMGLISDRNPRVREHALYDLSLIQDPKAIPHLIKVLNDKAETVSMRETAAGGLSRFREKVGTSDEKVVKALAESLKSAGNDKNYPKELAEMLMYQLSEYIYPKPHPNIEIRKIADEARAYYSDSAIGKARIEENEKRFGMHKYKNIQNILLSILGEIHKLKT